jgi:beta-lactamase class A
MRRTLAILALAASFIFTIASPAKASPVAPPLSQLRHDISKLVGHLPASSALEVFDLSTGMSVGYNANASMPAASTIKVPVMVDVFQQLEAGRFNLQRHVTLLPSDKDWGSGELCDAPAGGTYTVAELLSKMIDISDNTATNMLIRLVGLHNINSEMSTLGLRHTRLRGDVRTAGWSIRQTLRSSPSDMVRLLSMMARHQLVDDWSSKEMISILEDDQFNTLLPAALPDDVQIAHKTGSLFDTLNDVGIVYADEAPYVIAVMTTGLPSLDQGRSFIHSLSRMAFQQELRLAQWRSIAGLDTGSFSQPQPAAPIANSPDVRYWHAASGGAGGSR